MGIRIRIRRREGRVGNERKGKGAITSPSNSKTAWSGVGYKNEFGCEYRSNLTGARNARNRYGKKSRMYSNKPSVLI
jgi:hypothetical protein